MKVSEMPDEELLLLAAEAGKVFLTEETLKEVFPKWKWDKDYLPMYTGHTLEGVVVWYGVNGELGGVKCTNWNSLEDDVDAFRLSVKLGMITQNDRGFGCVPATASAHIFSGCTVYSGNVQYTDNPYAAMRRAITIAAASYAYSLKGEKQ